VRVGVCRAGGRQANFERGGGSIGRGGEETQLCLVLVADNIVFGVGVGVVWGGKGEFLLDVGAQQGLEVGIGRRARRLCGRAQLVATDTGTSQDRSGILAAAAANLFDIWCWSIANVVKTEGKYLVQCQFQIRAAAAVAGWSVTSSPARLQTLIRPLIPCRQLPLSTTQHILTT
jgi:hypothetical protein